MTIPNNENQFNNFYTEKLEITNKKIINFYNSHPNINIEEINLYIINIIDTVNIKDTLNNASSNILSIMSTQDIDKITIPLVKNKESYFIGLLSQIYPTGDIVLKDTNNYYDIISMKRLKKPKILIQNITNESNVSTDQIATFNNILDEQNCCGIILSQKSGISNKQNFQIDIHNNNIIVYVHNANFANSIISSAIDIIDNLYQKIQDFSIKTGQEYSIPKDLLDNINNEFQLFIIQKTALIDMTKEYQKKILSQVEEFRFTTLHAFLSEKYSAPIQKTGFNCELCKSYSAHNLKALAAHKRGCLRKKNQLSISITSIR